MGTVKNTGFLLVLLFLLSEDNAASVVQRRVAPVVFGTGIDTTQYEAMGGCVSCLVEVHRAVIHAAHRHGLRWHERQHASILYGRVLFIN